MKVLVTGANGFLANNVIRELEMRDIRVRAMVRPSANPRSFEDLHTEIFVGDFTDQDSASNAVKDCQVVIHVAADTSQSYGAGNFNIQCNVNGTRVLLDAAVSYNVERFIFVSSANTFAHGTKETPGDERRPARYPFTLSGYTISKLKAQELVLQYAKNGLPAIVVNPAFMIGQYDYKPSSGRIITMMYGKKFIPVPPGGKNFIHVKDAAVAICNAITEGQPGNCYLLANENLTYSEFYKKVQMICGKKQYQVRLKKSMLMVAGYLGEITSYTGLKHELNPFNARILCEGNYFTGAKAVNEIGLPQTSVDMAISDALEWFGRNGFLK